MPFPDGSAPKGAEPTADAVHSGGGLSDILVRRSGRTLAMLGPGGQARELAFLPDLQDFPGIASPRPGPAGTAFPEQDFLPVLIGAGFVLAVWKKGWSFTLRTVLCVGIVSAFSLLHEHWLTIGSIHPLHAVIGGNLMVGVGLLIVFRHGASLGGFNVLALILQEHAGLRAGYVQMALDVTVILLGLTVIPWTWVLLSALGVVVLNLVLALNHRPGRYRA